MFSCNYLGLPLEGVVGYRLLHLSLYSEVAAVGMSIVMATVKTIAIVMAIIAVTVACLWL